MTNPLRFRLVAGVLFSTAWPAAVADTVPVLVPPPKQVTWSDKAPLVLRPDDVVIVLGSKSLPAEQAAADVLQRRVAGRFHQTWPILSEADDLSGYTRAILLGQRVTCSRIRALLDERQIQLEPAMAAGDGYVIEILPAGRQTIILVAGANARGVTYGQDTLFQLLRRQGSELQLIPAAVRDRASIPWRGRPMTDFRHYLEAGTWDGLISARMNWIDLRNGTYAFEPGYTFTDQDRTDIAAVISEAHRREILVYGAVNCGVPAGQYGAVTDKFRQFIEWGTDGLWLSFDDRGPGAHPEQITYDVLNLGLAHGTSGNRIAITPPKGSYQTVLAPFNRKIMRVAGMERALWFWTPLPDERVVADTRTIGLKTRPSWWHNWPRVDSGFTHIRGGNLSTDLSRSYVEIPALELGWHEPSYEMLRDAARDLQAAVPWSGNGIAKEYVAPAFGWWAWSPEQHDWPAARRRIYDTVYGRHLVSTMMELDDTLARAKSLFVYAQTAGQWRPRCPARLRNLDDRPLALELLAKCESLAERVAARFAEGTLIDPERVETTFVLPMQREIRVGKLCAALDYPEYWWDEHQRKLLDAVHAGQNAKADQLIAAVRPRLTEAVERVGRELGMLSITPAYAAFWTRAARMSAAQWRNTLQQRQAELPRRVWHFSYYSVVLGGLLEHLDNPPLGLGRGGARRQMRVLATALPEVREQYWGDWIAGIHQEGDARAAVFAMEPNAAARAGDYAELPVRLPVSGDRARLGLLVVMNRWTKDSLGLEEVPGRWMGYASVELLWEDRLVWQGDVGLPRTGQEWDLVALPPIPVNIKELALRLRVVDHRDSNGMRAIVFVGPIRLVEMPRGTG